MGGEGGKSIVAPLSLSELHNIEAHLRMTYRQAIINETGVLTGTDNIISNLPMAAETPPTTFQRGESAGAQRASDINMSGPYICYAAKPNSLIIRANGRIGKCTVALDDERNDLGYLADDGSLIINEKKILPWIRGIETLDSNITGCPINGMPASDLASPAKPLFKKIKIASRT